MLDAGSWQDVIAYSTGLPLFCCKVLTRLIMLLELTGPVGQVRSVQLVAQLQLYSGLTACVIARMRQLGQVIHHLCSLLCTANEIVACKLAVEEGWEMVELPLILQWSRTLSMAWIHALR